MGTIQVARKAYGRGVGRRHTLEIEKAGPASVYVAHHGTDQLGGMANMPKWRSGLVAHREPLPRQRAQLARVRTPSILPMALNPDVREQSVVHTAHEFVFVRCGS